MKRLLTTLALVTAMMAPAWAQTSADEVLSVTRRVNDYFMQKYEDPTVPTNWKRIRPSSLWTRAVYYEGLMALHSVDPQKRYIDYALQWSDFHKWQARGGTKSTNADNQCCQQTYIELNQLTGKGTLQPTKENLEYQMVTPNAKAGGALYGWWTWIDAIQMAMPLYMQVAQLTGEKKYCDHAMKMYRWSRNELAGGLFNVKEGLWWRDAD